VFVVVDLSQLANEWGPDCALLVNPCDERGGMEILLLTLMEKSWL